MKKHKLLDIVLTLAIPILMLSMLYLFIRVWAYDENLLTVEARQFVSKLSWILGIEDTSETEPYSGSRAETYGEMTVPVGAVLRNSERLSSVVHGKDAISAYSRAFTLVGECLGSGSEIQRTTKYAWQQALLEESIYFRYSDQISLELLARSLGVDMPESRENIFVDRLLLIPDDGIVSVLLADDKNHMRMTCSVSYTAFESVLTSSIAAIGEPSSDPVFVFETGISSSDTLLRDSAPIISASTPGINDTAFGSILEVFGISPLTDKRYTSPSGSRMAVDDSRNVTLRSDGILTYSDQGRDQNQSQILNQNQEQDYGIIFNGSSYAVIEGVRRIAQSTAGSFLGDARLTLREFSSNEGVYTIGFGATAYGGNIYLNGDLSSCRFRVEDGRLTYAWIVFRKYTQLESSPLLPAERAEQLSKSNVELTFQDSGSTEDISACWTGEPIHGRY